MIRALCFYGSWQGAERRPDAEDHPHSHHGGVDLGGVGSCGIGVRDRAGNRTPANGKNGQSGNHAPSPTIKSHPSSNDNGVSNSPALVYNGSSVGSACGAF